MAIGQRCEVMWRDAEKSADAAALQTATAAVSRHYAKANAIPVDQRKAWCSGRGGPVEPSYRDYLDDVKDAMRVDQGIDPASRKKPARLITIRPKRPKGIHKQIIERVAAEESAKRGLAISPRYARSCWEEYRRFERELETDV